MTIRARCPHCDGELAYEDADAGIERECPFCRGGLRVPLLLRYACYICDTRYQSAPHHAGRHFKCRHCDDQLTVPEESTIIPAPESAGEEGAMVGEFGARADREGFSDSSGDLGENTMDKWFDDEEGEDTGTDGDDERPTGPRKNAATTLTQYSPAGIVRRFAAAVVDMSLLGTVFGLAGVGLGAGASLIAGGVPDETVIDKLILSGYGAVVILTLLYVAGFESADSQATPGKRLLHIMVTGTDGHRLSLGRALARNAAKLVSLLPAGLGFLLPLFTKKRQALHDLIAGAQVVLN